MNWAPYLIPAIILLIADALGWIDLSTRPLRRILKWFCIVVVLWLLPLLGKGLFKLKIDSELLYLWKASILGVFAVAVLFIFLRGLWNFFKPLPEGYQRCPKCRHPVVKLMLECPHCRKSL